MVYFLLCLVGGLGSLCRDVYCSNFKRTFIEGICFRSYCRFCFLSFFWFSTLGGSALILEIETPGIISTDVLNYGSTAMFGFLKQFPWSIITSLMALIVVAIFFITSSDSGYLVIDSISTGGKLNPPIGQRILWTVTEGIVAIALLIGGGSVRCKRSMSV